MLWLIFPPCFLIWYKSICHQEPLLWFNRPNRNSVISLAPYLRFLFNYVGQLIWLSDNRATHSYMKVGWLRYSEVSNKLGVFLILFEKIFPTTCLIRTSTFINFWGILPPTRLLEPPRLFILGEIPNYKIILTSFKHLFCCFNHFKVTSKSQTKPE